MSGNHQTNINKTNRQSPHERISNVSGANSDGARWKLTLGKAIENTIK